MGGSRLPLSPSSMGLATILWNLKKTSSAFIDESFSVSCGAKHPDTIRPFDFIDTNEESEGQSINSWLLWFFGEVIFMSNFRPIAFSRKPTKTATCVSCFFLWKCKRGGDTWSSLHAQFQQHVGYMDANAKGYIWGSCFQAAFLSVRLLGLSNGYLGSQPGADFLKARCGQILVFVVQSEIKNDGLKRIH